MAGELSSPPWLEIIVPVRNPGAPFLQTVASLEAQSERGFAVVLSDNHSTSGEEKLREARARLEGTGIPVRAVRPPSALSRVEHWNWAHHAAQAAWLKPLLAGDLLEPSYVARLRERVAQVPTAQVVRCDFDFSTGDTRDPARRPPAGLGALTPPEFLRYYPKLGNWLGGTINFAYTRLAWLAAGGYAVHLPGSADLALYVALALRHGLELLPESLAVFALPDDPPRRRIIRVVELWLILREARNYCETVELPLAAVRRRSRSVLTTADRLINVRPWKARLFAALGHRPPLGVL